MIQRIGFGTYSLSFSTGIPVIETTLIAGYQLIENAFNYENEMISEIARSHGKTRLKIIFQREIDSQVILIPKVSHCAT